MWWIYILQQCLRLRLRNLWGGHEIGRQVANLEWIGSCPSSSISPSFPSPSTCNMFLIPINQMTLPQDVPPHPGLGRSFMQPLPFPGSWEARHWERGALFLFPQTQDESRNVSPSTFSLPATLSLNTAHVCLGQSHLLNKLYQRNNVRLKS